MANQTCERCLATSSHLFQLPIASPQSINKGLALAQGQVVNVVSCYYYAGYYSFGKKKEERRRSYGEHWLWIWPSNQVQCVTTTAFGNRVFRDRPPWSWRGVSYYSMWTKERDEEDTKDGRWDSISRGSRDYRARDWNNLFQRKKSHGAYWKPSVYI